MTGQGVLAAARALRTADRARLAQMVVCDGWAISEWDESEPESFKVLRGTEAECLTLLYTLFKAVDAYEAELCKSQTGGE